MFHVYFGLTQFSNMSAWSRQPVSLLIANLKYDTCQQVLKLFWRTQKSAKKQRCAGISTLINAECQLKWSCDSRIPLLSSSTCPNIVSKLLRVWMLYRSHVLKPKCSADPPQLYTNMSNLKFGLAPTTACMLPKGPRRPPENMHGSGMVSPVKRLWNDTT
jgi:hypothetical protein